ncbi:unnamed protein product [Urochloa decumbens]|uniref:DUF1618 domain-containing protein n=1 Tax=Urochloa decumbens TaxID=240449 RepID=A0ABC9BZR7_9POAL
MASRSPKRRRRNDERCGHCAKRKHLYLALDDWRGGYSVHKLDADDMPDHLSEPPAVRVTGPDWGQMSFAGFGTNILIALNQRCPESFPTAPRSLIYSTDTAALTVGPCLPHDHFCDLDSTMTTGGKLYARSWVFDKDRESPCFSDHMQILRPTGLEDLWDPSFRWSWDSKPIPPSMLRERRITCQAMHPDGRTIFMSTDCKITYSYDTNNGEWKDLGDWELPFKDQAYFDRDLDAWVGLHATEDGCVCLCPVASRSTAATQPPKCTMLKERLRRYNKDDPRYQYPMFSREKATSLTYMGDGRFCLVEDIACSEFVYRDGSVVHVTLFGLKYDNKGELRTKAHRTTRSYAVSKNGPRFSHAMLWI